MKSRISIIIMISILISNFIFPVIQVFAQNPIPTETQGYALPGEKIVAMKSVSLNGKQYKAYYFTTGSVIETEGEIFYQNTKYRWIQDGIQGILVFDGTQVVRDPTLMRQVFITILSGYMLTHLNELPEVITADPNLIKQMNDLTDNPLYQLVFIEQKIKSLFQTTDEQDAEALRVILVAQDQNAKRLEDFNNEVITQAENYQTIEEAIDQAITVAKYSNDPTVREIAKEGRSLFKGWEKYTDQGRYYINVDGIKVDFANALDLVSLGFQLIYLDNLSLERANMLDRLLSASRTNTPPLPPSLQVAIAQVVSEARSASSQREEVIYQFIKDKAADVVNELGGTVLTQLWTQWAWDTFGKQTIGHLVAGAASEVLLGYTIANILFGMDAIYDNTVIGQRAALMEETFKDAGSWTLLQRQGMGQVYDAQLADTYRTCVFFKNLSAAQVYRSYADSISGSRLIKSLGDLVSGGQWTEAEKFFRNWGNESELKIEDLIGHPAIIDYAIELAQDRINHIPGLPISGSSTVLVFDTSGSMQGQTPDNIGKLQAAKNAGSNILDIIAAENQTSSGTGSQVGIVDFNVDARVDSGLSSDVALAQNALNSLNANGGTGMPYGLKVALDQYTSGAGASGKQIIILLSDGQPNIGLNGENDVSIVQQQVLDLAKQAEQDKICIYTVGFGDPTASDENLRLDEEFLKQVANTSGCGTYNNAQSANQLANVYIELRHTSMGNVLLKQNGQISQGQTVDIGKVKVPTNQSLMLFTLNWPGSSLAPILVDPAGSQIDANYPNASISSSATLATIIVNNPHAGQWSVSAQGVDVPEGTTTYNAILSTRAGAMVAARPSGGLAVVVIILALVGGGTAIYVINPKKRRKKPAPRQPVGAPAVQLFGLSGSIAGQSIPAGDGFTIGRAATCQLRLVDRTVSRQHARLRLANGQWFIQDLGSASGTLVNGQRVQAARLNPGDQITIGGITFIFKEA